MSRETESRRGEGQRGYQPRPESSEGLGYQPQGSGQVDPSAVKPPQGDTAIVRPEKAAPKQ